MYQIFKRNYPQADINITEEWELLPFSRLDRAQAFVADLEKLYDDPSWAGHPMYRAKFYAEEVK